jgi:hypothetical protein
MCSLSIAIEILALFSTSGKGRKEDSHPTWKKQVNHRSKVIMYIGVDVGVGVVVGGVLAMLVY